MALCRQRNSIKVRLEEEKALREDDNKNLTKVNRNIGLFLLHNPLTTDLTFDEREKIINVKNAREQAISNETFSLDRIEEDVKKVTAEFTEKLLQVVNRPYDISSEDDFSSEDDNESMEETGVAKKRSYESIESKSELVEEEPMVKLPKFENRADDKHAKESDQNQVRSENLYKYKFLEFYADPKLSTREQLYAKLQPRKIYNFLSSKQKHCRHQKILL